MQPRVRSFVAVLAGLALMVGGFARVAVASDPGRPCHPVATASSAALGSDRAHVAHDDASHDDASNEHDHDAHHAAHHDHATGADGSAADHACFKCCGLCTTVGTYAISRITSDVLLIAEAVVYRIGTQSFTSRPVIIDPGIPKRMG